MELREEDLIEESEAAEELSAQEDVSEEALTEPVVQETMTPAAVNAEAMEDTLSGTVTQPQELKDRVSDLEDSTVSREETIEVVSGNGASTNGATFEENKEEKLSEQIETEIKIGRAHV